MLVQVLDLATPTLRELAREAGISYHAIRMYRKGVRTPSAAVLARLAMALRRRGQSLVTAAQQVERAQGRTPHTGRQG